MNLVSFGFLCFVLLVVVLYYAMPMKLRPPLLLLLSLAFYLYAGINYIFFLLFTVLSTFYGARLLQGTEKHRKAILATVLTANLAVLAVVKYLPFSMSLLEAALGVELPGLSMIVPLGISFYTLQAMAYIIDVSRGKIQPEKSLWRYGLFMSFFPIIMQGPISRYDQLSQQLSNPHKLEYTNLKFGAQLMLWGYFKKLVIADRAGIAVNQVFNNYADYHGLVIFLVSFLYLLELYADFSGCVDICRGISKMLGIELMDNFRHPFFSVSVQDFWRRWHISLSSWLRDYLYIPLGGNRKGAFRKQLNTLIVFTVSGLWHGAGLNYIFWGALHGIFLIIGSLTRAVRQRFWQAVHVSEDSFGLRLLRIILTWPLVVFAFLFFRANGLSAGLHMAVSMFSGFSLSQLTDGSLLNLGLDMANIIVLLSALLVLLIVSIMQEHCSVRQLIARQRLPIRWGIYLIGLMAVLIFGQYGPGYSSAQFIYMNF
jgi:D-alanyl-lipoteichoic acid acyltransferase DltB (MBOAT superfamily)